MVLGYPGRTHRYRLASEVESRFTWFYPTARAVYARALELIDEIARRRKEIEIKYASTIAGMSNAAKNYQGMIDGYAASGMLDRKLELERELEAWIEADEARREVYGPALEELRAAVERKLYGAHYVASILRGAA